MRKLFSGGLAVLAGIVSCPRPVRCMRDELKRPCGNFDTRLERLKSFLR